MKRFLLYFIFIIATHGALAQNVGIGTTTPGMALHISKAADTALLLLENRATLGTGTNAGLYLKNGNYITGAIKAIGTGTNIARLSFFTYADPNPNNLRERFSITDDGYVGIGNNTPTTAGLVVDNKIGAVNAMFGSNTTGVAIESNFPGIGFNSFYGGGTRRTINTGYGSLIGQNPASGLFTIATSASSITGSGTQFTLTDRINIKPDGNIGIQGNADPQSPLSFANTLGEKLNFYHVNSTANYGIGIQGSQLQIHAGGAGDAISFGYGNSNAFTENMRINGNGNVGIGIVATTEKLEVAGSIKIVDGTQGPNKVLTSDANGKGSWKGSSMNSAFRASFPTTSLVNAGYTILPYNTSGANNYDDGGYWSNLNNRYTAAETGVYHFDAIVTFGSFFQTSSGATIELRMVKNNSSVSEANTRFSTNTPDGAFDLTVNLSWTLKLNAGEFLNFQIYQLSGQARPTTGILSGYRVY